MPFAYNIRVMFVRIIIIITHSDRALFNLNALVSSLGTIVPSAYGLGHQGWGQVQYLYLSTYLSVLDVLEYLVYGNVKVLVLVLVLDQKILGTYK